MNEFKKFVYTPAGYNDASLAIAACRAGGIGILNAELSADSDKLLEQFALLSVHARNPFGIKVDTPQKALLSAAAASVDQGFSYLIVDELVLASLATEIKRLRKLGVTVLVEVTNAHTDAATLEKQVDGLMVKGYEAGGFVGEGSSFILLQKWSAKTGLPLFVRGGITPHVAAACSAVGAKGGVLESQVLLLKDSPLSERLSSFIGNLSGNETIAVGDEELGAYFRVLVRPGYREAQAFNNNVSGRLVNPEDVLGKIDWDAPQKGLLPLGQDVCFAKAWREKYGYLSNVFAAIDQTIHDSMQAAIQYKPLAENAPLAEALGVRFPLVQGPMSRVSDSAEFAGAVADGGALPMLAFALLKGAALDKLLAETDKRLGDKPWGIGLLGFAPQSLLDEQIELAQKYKPQYAIIAGGRPDQAVKLEQEGIQSFLHVPSANLIPLFLQEGARRFIFEGRECGGHIGPLSSFVLWSSMVDRLLEELESGKTKGEGIQLLFAGGIHDAASAAMVQVLAAPLLDKGVQVGALMGSSYLFTKEIVESGAIVPAFQKEVVECEHTVSLESGPGHASRCAYTPFAKMFFDKRREMIEQGVPVDEARATLDDLIMGRLRIASKGCARLGENAKLTALDEATQHADGMYMLGQVATLRTELIDVETLHAQVTEDSHALLVANSMDSAQEDEADSSPVDIAIVGISGLFPGANSTEEYWSNILDKVDAITEIPSHRWDWRLYFDEDRYSKDKIYSRWGGFIDDLAFDPTKYGMPPKSVEAVDPMQLMALEVASRTLADAGYDKRDFDRENASVIIGASGGAGDVGMQYGLRAEMPRFKGDLPDHIADILPEWTEDSFAGILINVMAGRIANRLNFGGVNFTTDAACASSLAAIYQGISELSAGRSNMVLAGGVDTVQGPFGYLCFSKTQALSPRGRCSTFDVSGDGIVISEGIAMVAMKRLADAERDGDQVYAVIKGVGGSSDGKAKGLTAPLPQGQLRAMRRAYKQAGFGPETVGLFEAHGTGTVAGDTAELESTISLLKEAGAGTHQAVVGSVKTMIGHTKAAAGVAGLIKACLALKHQTLPPHYGVTQPNNVLMGEDCPLYLVDEAQPWIKKEQPRRAACSAFGFGGTNFHVVMEEYQGEYRPWMKKAVRTQGPAELLIWSEDTTEALIATLSNVAKELTSVAALDLKKLSFNLINKHKSGLETVTLVVRDQADFAEKVVATLGYLKDEISALPEGAYYGNGQKADGKVAAIFPGQGAQYPQMGRELAYTYSTVGNALSDADKLLKAPFEKRFAGRLLSGFIYPRGAYTPEQKTAATQALTSTDVTQPALGAVETGLWRMLKTLGFKADMFAGHSYGEFVALHAAGAFDYETLVSLSEARGRFIVDEAKRAGDELGTMAAVQATRDKVETAIKQIDGVIVANHNAPTQCIISGSKAGIAQAIEALSQTDIMATPIPVAAAFHSSFVKPAQSHLAKLIESTKWISPELPVYSNSTGDVHDASVAKLKSSMAAHLVNPVEFVAEIEAMYRDGARIFVEVGPKSILSRLTKQILGDRPHTTITLDNDQEGVYGLLSALANLVCEGVELDLQPLLAGIQSELVSSNGLENYDSAAPISKQTWMLNGSGARRATEAVRQIGVTLEQVLAQNSVAAEASSAGSVMTTVPSPQINENISYDRHHFKHNKERKMDGRRQAPNAGGPAVMAEYFDMMRQFLESQESVMSMYLSGTPVPRSGETRPQRLPKTAPQMAELSMEVPVVAAPVAAPVVAPVAAPAPAPVAVAPVAAPAPAPVAAPVAEAKPATDDTFDREKITQMLLEIVEDKTGYPSDMVGLDQKLEADLGIDSIKRIEIVGSLLKALPAAYGDALGENRGQLNTQENLTGMLDLLCDLPVGAATSPFKVAGVRTEVSSTLSDSSFRHVVVPSPAPIEVNAKRALNIGHYVITRDAADIAGKLAALLTDRGCTVQIVEPSVLEDEEQILKFSAAVCAEKADLAGVIHLAEIGSPALMSESSVVDFKAVLNSNEKSFFLLLKGLSPAFSDAAHIVAASGLGGAFGRTNAVFNGLSLQSGFVGCLKSVSEERPALRVKAIDLDAEQSVGDLANILLEEMMLCGGRQEVGYPAGKRTIFKTVAEVAPQPAENATLDGLTVLATGGLRGITAEVLREVALPGNTLLLTGRSPLPEPETAETAALKTEAELRQFFIAQVRDGILSLTPAEVMKKVAGVIGAREMLSNLQDFQQRGAKVEYFAVDVTDESSMKGLLDTIYDKYGALHGVVHGAGIIEDKLLQDKTSESWSRVVETKVLGLFHIQKYVRPESLRFLTVFSSVAGRYGNSGQLDYATANELLNRLCSQLNQLWKNKVVVRSLCWGPWGPTQFGEGMVTAETEAKFAEKGVALVTAKAGRDVFREEILQQPSENIEVICGIGPWEKHEATIGRVEFDESIPRITGALLDNARVTAMPKGDQVVEFYLSDRHEYLQQHRIDNIPVLPAAVALEIMSETVTALWPGWHVVEARDSRLLKGLQLDDLNQKLKVVVNPPPYGSSDGFDVTVSLQSEKRMHYKAVLRLEQTYPESFTYEPEKHSDKQLSVETAYNEWLFHGPCFQVIKKIAGLSQQGSVSDVETSTPAGWLSTVMVDDGWVFDPAMTDAAAQMALLWGRTFNDQSALPARFGKVMKFQEKLPEKLRMCFARKESEQPNTIVSDVYFVDEKNNVALLIEDLECISSMELNRLGGTEKLAL
jgi:acyl transferase domain-containing protein/NAD(P)H-dependent flavin oxidoreductase YrpB (nitropropane dioxygenase family)/NAD(P)-dependent dehydrogenase (short-subunit alcohol dehydrogenase family)